MFNQCAVVSLTKFQQNGTQNLPKLLIACSDVVICQGGVFYLSQYVEDFLHFFQDVGWILRKMGFFVLLLEIWRQARDNRKR